jgi:methylmalonyl-CoA/ethylmalonyl-CoA epimerase
MFHPEYALHHVGIVVADIESRGAEMVDRFGYVVATAVIEDLAQTAFVQFFLQQGGTHWVELVMPNGPGSKLEGAVRKGQTLHHLCYEVTDIEAAARHLRESSMFMVGPPAPAVAFGGRPIAWFMDRIGMLVELVEAGPGPLQLATLTRRP